MTKKPGAILFAVMLCALCVAPAHALEYTFHAPDDYLFGQPTSDDTIYEWKNPNVDRSKNTAQIPPTFGSPTSSVQASYHSLPATAESSLTPLHLLSPQSLEGGFAGTPWGNATGGGYPATSTNVSVDSSDYPTVDIGVSSQTVAFTDVTSSMYYSDGSLGTLKIPSIGLTVKVYEGTDTAALAKGAGHFTDTSIWSGNICVAGHNRGVHACFGKIHTLKIGAAVTLTTALGTLTYAVTSVEKVAVTDTSGLSATSSDQLTLYTCVQDQPAYRWCVKASAVDLA